MWERSLWRIVVRPTTILIVVQGQRNCDIYSLKTTGPTMTILYHALLDASIRTRSGERGEVGNPGVPQWGNLLTVPHHKNVQFWRQLAIQIIFHLHK